MKPNEELLQRIAQTRRKWKIFIGTRGAAWALGIMVLAALAVLWTAEKGGGYAALTAVAIAGTGALVWAVVKTLALPLWRPPTDTQMAKFVEERNPGLEDRLVSAVEAVRKPNPNHGAFSILLVKDALERTKDVRFGEEISKRKSRGFTAMAAAFAIVLLLGPWVAPIFFPFANQRLMASLFDQPMDVPTLAVTPGDVTVPRGDDLRIEAALKGFDPSRATIFMFYDTGKDWESATMEVIPQKQPTYRHVLYNLQGTVRYYVEAGDKRSQEFKILVADLPKVEKVDYTYNYPAYTGLASKKEENAINIAALRGSTVDVVVTANQALASGRLIFDDGKEVALKALNGALEANGRVTVDHNAKFHIELTNTEGATFKSLDERFMEVLDDGKPLLTFTKPGRDYSASALEEVFTELKAEDDYGVRSLTLFYSVNGGTEKRIDLYQERTAVSPKEISAPHTFFLEEFSLKPGDFVSYYGKAEDSRTPANKVTTDVYFIEVRPLDRQLTQDQSGGGGGGGGRGGGGERDSIQVLLKGEKDVIAATHKLINNKDDYKAQEWTSYVHSAGTRQKKLADQTDRMLDRIDSRGLDDDASVKEITENLKLAQKAMEEAVKRLEKEKPEQAVEVEQQALIHLGRANAQYTKFQVQRGGGGGGGKQQDLADDLKELADLELDQNKNNFETQQRGQQPREQQLEEAADELKKLAERQQKAAERRQSPGARAEAQELREELQRLARQLEKLSRDTNDPKMAEVSKQLDRAAENLRQQQQASNDKAAAAASQQAAEAIQRAQNLLGQNQQGGPSAERFAEAERQGQRLADIQKQITNQTQQVAKSPETAGSRSPEINRQRDTLENDLNSLRQRLDALGNTPNNRDAANQARAAANSIRDRRIPEGIETGRQALNSGAFGAAAQQEQRNQQAINELQQQIAQAARSAAGNQTPNSPQNTEQNRLQSALDGVSQLNDRLQSLERRLQANAGAQGQPQNRPGTQQQPNGAQGRGETGPQGQPGGRGEQRGGPPSQQASNPQGRGPGQQPNPQGQPGGNQPGTQGTQGDQGKGTSNNNQGRGEGQPQSAGSPGGQFAPGDATMPGANGIDPRQLSSEIGEYLRQLRDIRSTLGPNSPYNAQLNSIENALRSMGSGGTPGDAKQLELLARQIIDPFRSIEYDLSRQLELVTNRERLRAARDEDIPANMKNVIGNYFERLGKSKP